MRRPSLSARVLRGLGEVVDLAAADLESDPERYPPSCDAWAALDYLRKLERWRTAQEPATGAELEAIRRGAELVYGAEHEHELPSEEP
jgi:hypothetical protein